jgi:Lrp/AsnC family leucine-responsive transcriptional regulator
MAIDEIDIKILNTLIKNSRTSIKAMAKECNISSNAVFKRIRQLEDSGVIMGYSVLMSTKNFGPQNFTALWLTIDLTREAEAMKYLHESKRFNIFRCVGSCDIVAYYVSNNMQELEDMLHDLKKQEWSRKVIVNIFNDNKLSLENVKLEPVSKRRT